VAVVAELRPVNGGSGWGGAKAASAGQSTFYQVGGDRLAIEVD
jgi:hypothetical protein